jgi:tRNA 2-thiouridine synthesizing protein A
MPVAADQTLDCSDLDCPIPILKTKKAIDSLQIGQVLKVIATDPGSPSDMVAWTQKTGHALLTSERDGRKFIFFIRKSK